MTLSELTAFLGNHLILTTLWAVLFILLVASLVQGALSGIKKVKAQEAVFLINQDNTLVVDVRAQADFKKAHIAGALNLSKDTLLKGDVSRLEKHKDAPIILVCDMGHSASQVAKQLSKAGFKSLFVLSGGIQGWRDAGMPVKG
ncbi:rhodanese-like domain-containing protein [Gallaecimonas xiamenensis]|uniref:Rhodanese domain-containing protein n=1 Tax=Gallaecimonas xiamenensis 3-C-1 TaxID=745411 RepID=K2JEG7_9GAMM|nr:rhodanese-like domain-containing protein [Gallaecimonas xiamenensis]EKE73042.1 rhodanese domain-containing protein [Gallaecimonas xiamenensis 3-C-1]